MNASKTLTGRLAGAFIDSKITVVMILACALMGVLAVLYTAREENPQITMPVAVVTVLMPGSEPAEIEGKVLRPLEAAINQIPGIDHVTSGAADNAAQLIVQFKVGEEKENSLTKVNERVMGARGALPPGAIGPFVKTQDADDVPILAVTLASDRYDTYAMRRVAERVLENLQSLEDISSSFVMGGSDREFTVTADPRRLQAYGLSFEQVRLAVMTSDTAVTAGTVAVGNQSVSVRVSDRIEGAQQLGGIIVALHDGRPVRLSDIADISDGPDNHLSHLSRFERGPADARYQAGETGQMNAVTLAVAKKKGTNAVTVARDVTARIERMQPSVIPSDMQVIITRNDGVKADRAVDTLIMHLGIAVAAVVIVTMLFLGWHAAVIVAVTVPLILAITLAVVGLCGLTINRVTLYALIIALGLLVDDSIVVIENIVRHYGLSPITSREDKLHRSVEAPGEIGYATLLATISVMVVFGSLVPTLTGMPGQYFYPVGFAVPVALAASFFVAYIVGPWAALRWMPAPAPKAAQEKKDAVPGGRLGAFYNRLARPLIGYKWRERGFMLFLLVLLTLAFLMPAWQFIRPSGPGGAVPLLGVPISLLPKDNKNTFNVTVKTPEGTPVEMTDRLVREVAELVRTIPEVTDMESWSGLSGIPDFNSLIRGDPLTGDNIGAVRVNFTDKNSRKRDTIEIARELREALRPVSARWPGATIQVVEDPPGPPMAATVMAEIYARDPSVRAEANRFIADEFSRTYDMAEIRSSLEADAPQWRLTIDRDKAVQAGVVPAQAVAALAKLVRGEVLAYAHTPGELNAQPVRLQIPYSAQFDPQALSGITVPGALGRAVPLSALVRTELTTAPKTVMHKDGLPMNFVGGELGSTQQTYAVLDLDRRIRGHVLSDGSVITTGNISFSPERADLTLGDVVVLWQGEMRMMLTVYRDLLIALSFSLLSIFLILVVYYRSFMVPLIALSAVPLCFIGIFPGHWLFGTVISASSLVGVVALAGVVVRNSLLLIDFVNDYLREGLPLEDAVIDAGAVRLRPILLTTMAITLGSVILVTDPVFSGLAITFIFGSIVSAAFTVFLVPMLLLEYHRRIGTKPAVKAPAA